MNPSLRTLWVYQYFRAKYRIIKCISWLKLQAKTVQKLLLWFIQCSTDHLSHMWNKIELKHRKQERSKRHKKKQTYETGASVCWNCIHSHQTTGVAHYIRLFDSLCLKIMKLLYHVFFLTTLILPKLRGKYIDCSYRDNQQSWFRPQRYLITSVINHFPTCCVFFVPFATGQTSETHGEVPFFVCI